MSMKKVISMVVAFGTISECVFAMNSRSYEELEDDYYYQEDRYERYTEAVERQQNRYTTKKERKSQFYSTNNDVSRNPRERKSSSGKKVQESNIDALEEKKEAVEPAATATPKKVAQKITILRPWLKKTKSAAEATPTASSESSTESVARAPAENEVPAAATAAPVAAATKTTSEAQQTTTKA